MPTIEQTTQEHIDKMKGHLRDSDDRECWAVAHMKSDDALQMSFNRSSLCWTLLDEDDPILCFGAASGSLLSRNAYPWMLATDKINQVTFYFARNIRRYIQKYQDSYDMLFNWVDSRNKMAVRFVKFCGFHVEKPLPFGPDGIPFHHFWMRIN